MVNLYNRINVDIVALRTGPLNPPPLGHGPNYLCMTKNQNENLFDPIIQAEMIVPIIDTTTYAYIHNVYILLTFRIVNIT